MPADLQYVIELVNQARSCARMRPLSDLPKGKCADGDHCPIARALPGPPPLVQTDEVVWETFPGDSLPECIAKAWDERVTFLHDRPNHMAAYVVTMPAEIKQWIIEFDDQWHSPWSRYRER